MSGLTRDQRALAAREWRKAAAYEDAIAERAERDHADAPAWSAAASIGPHARARAAEAREIAARLEADTSP